jgi:hypothetical protein
MPEVEEVKQTNTGYLSNIPMIGEIKKTDTGYTLNKTHQGTTSVNTSVHNFNNNGTEISRQNYVGDYLDRDYAFNNATNELGRINSKGKMKDDTPTVTHKITPNPDGSFRIDEHDGKADTATTNYYDSNGKPQAGITLQLKTDGYGFGETKGYTLKKYDQSGLASSHKFNKNGVEKSAKYYNEDGSKQDEYAYNHNTHQLGRVRSNGTISSNTIPKTTHQITSNSRDGLTLDEYDDNGDIVTSHNYKYKLGNTESNKTASNQAPQVPQKTALGNFMSALRGDNQQTTNS